MKNSRQAPSFQLKEIRPHGTKAFPCAIYQTRALEKGTFVNHHWHDEIEILYFPGGDFRLDINMESFFIRSQCLYFINPGEIHGIITEKSGSFGDDAIVFHPNILSFEAYDATQTELLQPLQNGTLLFPRSIFPEHPAFSLILENFADIIQVFGHHLLANNPPTDVAITNDLTTQLYTKSSLLHILAILSSYHLFTSTNKHPDKRVEDVKTVVSYIKENYKEKIYVKDLASIINMNEQYFCRFFKKIIGRSPIEYVNEYRIKQAIYFLENSDLPVIDIGLECGYHNTGNFLREFKKYTNMTPLRYRKSFLSKTE